MPPTHTQTHTTHFLSVESQINDVSFFWPKKKKQEEEEEEEGEKRMSLWLHDSQNSPEYVTLTESDQISELTL